jgi:hypothetical protein
MDRPHPGWRGWLIRLKYLGAKKLLLSFLQHDEGVYHNVQIERLLAAALRK